MRKKLLALLAVLSFVFLPASAWASVFGDGYELQQVTVFSRHGVRSPLYGADSFAVRATPHKWLPWTAVPGELTLKGGAAEVLMGEYFRLWLEDEGLIPSHYVPGEGEVRLYANSFQRTIATARFFGAGFLPMGDTRVEYHYGINERDPVFMHDMNFTPELKEKVAQEMQQGDLPGKMAALQQDADKVMEILDYPKSKAGKEQPLIKAADYTLDMGKSLSIKGQIRELHRAADALTLQYYEERDDRKAAFGHAMSPADWQAVGRVAYFTLDSFFLTPTYGAVYARPLLAAMEEEMENPRRKFSLFCGHDLNMSTLLPALGVEDYTLSGSIPPKTPLGGKIVISRLKGQDGREYGDLRLVYANVQDIRSLTPLTLEHPAQMYQLKLKGLKANKDGLYRWEDVQKRFREAIAAGEKYTK